MKISEILKSKGHAVATIDPEVSLGVAVKTMATKSVGALVVSRDGRTIDGILSERDVVRGHRRRSARDRSGRGRGHESRRGRPAAPTTRSPAPWP